MAKNDKWLMTSTLFGVKPSNINMEKGIIEGVSTTTLGIALGHGVWLDSEFIDNTVDQGNSYKQGLKVRFGHPNMSSTALGTFLGRLKNFRRVGDQAKADLFLSNSAKEAPGGDLYNYVLSLADEDDTAFGMSIVFEQGEHYQLDKDGKKIYEGFTTKNKTFIELKKLLACDFVDDPAANPNGVFSAFNRMTMASQVTEFLDTHPEVLKIIDEQPEIMEQFKIRYNQYKLRKGSKMIDKKTIEVEDESLESGNTADVVVPVVPETKTELSTVTVPTEIVTPNELESFQLMADAEGYEFAKEHYGKSDIEILTLKNEQLKKENEDLKLSAGAEPVAFSEEESEQDIVSIVDALKSEGMSASTAWSKAIKENPELHKKYIK